MKLVSSLLCGTWTKLVYLNLLAFVTKCTQLMNISVKTVHIAKYRPSKNQSERSNLPQDSLITK